MKLLYSVDGAREGLFNCVPFVPDPSVPVLHELDFGGDVLCGAASDGDLHVGGAGQADMSARPRAIDAALMDDNDDAIERFHDGVVAMALCGAAGGRACG